jgi:peptide/nickel transport system permease protein
LFAHLLRRLPVLLLTLVGITAVVFGLVHLAPGDIVIAQGGKRVSRESVEIVRRQFHLDQPIWRQYLLWMGDLSKGDLGRSIQDGRAVVDRIGETLPNTLLLNLVSLVLTAAVAIPVGILAAARRGSRFDRWSGAGFFMMTSLPSFWLALVAGSFFSVKLGWLPLFGMTSDAYATLSPLGKLLDRALHLVLPTACLSVTSLAFFARLGRSSLLEVIRQDYIRTARAKGLPERTVLFHHAFRNALVPLVTLFGILLPAMISGSVIIERIFAWPGTGRLYFDAILVRDYPLIMGLTLFSAALTLAANLLADLLYAVVDPRVRLS